MDLQRRSRSSSWRGMVFVCLDPDSRAVARMARSVSRRGGRRAARVVPVPQPQRAQRRLQLEDLRRQLHGGLPPADRAPGDEPRRRCLELQGDHQGRSPMEHPRDAATRRIDVRRVRLVLADVCVRRLPRRVRRRALAATRAQPLRPDLRVLLRRRHRPRCRGDHQVQRTGCRRGRPCVRARATQPRLPATTTSGS